MKHALRLFRTDRRATAAMEFAVVLPILLTLVAGTVEFGRWFQAFDGVNRLAARYAAVYADCNDNPSNLPTSPKACNTELAQYWPNAAVANIAPQLSNGTVSIRMFQVQYASDGTSTVIYSYPTNAVLSTTEATAGTNAVYSSGTTQMGVVVTVNYTFAPLVFTTLFQRLSGNGPLNLTYTVAQRKT